MRLADVEKDKEALWVFIRAVNWTNQYTTTLNKQTRLGEENETEEVHAKKRHPLTAD